MTMNRPKIRFRPLDGILLLDKPAGMSSNAALQAARRLFRAEKGGHTGSLDPLATGLLPLCFGEATKLAGLLLGSDKAYEAGIVLGTTTDTDDADGQPLRRRPVPALDRAGLEAALAPFTGVLQQRAPVYSALKQGGEPLYARARRGEAIEAPVRQVEVRAIELLAEVDHTYDHGALRVTDSRGPRGMSARRRSRVSSDSGAGKPRWPASGSHRPDAVVSAPLPQKHPSGRDREQKTAPG